MATNLLVFSVLYIDVEQGIARSTCVIGSGRRQEFASWTLGHMVVIA
jgi:hypothetical protein